MVAFNIGGISIYRYGIFYFVAFIVSYFFLKYIGKTKLFKDRPRLQELLEKGSEDIILYSLLGILIGGRLGHILIYENGYYIKHINEIMEVRKGGMSFIGGMIGVSISFLILKKIKKLSRIELLLLFDCILAIVPFGIMIGRFGNFLNQELYGMLVPSGFRSMGYGRFSILHDLHIFHVYPAVDDRLRVNTNLLSMIFEGFTILVITLSIIYHRVKKQKYHAGQITGTFLIIYSIVRFMLEYLRYDSQSEFIGLMSKSQRFFVFFFLLGLFILVYRRFSYILSFQPILSLSLPQRKYAKKTLGKDGHTRTFPSH